VISINLIPNMEGRPCTLPLDGSPDRCRLSRGWRSQAPEQYQCCIACWTTNQSGTVLTSSIIPPPLLPSVLQIGRWDPSMLVVSIVDHTYVLASSCILLIGLLWVIGLRSNTSASWMLEAVPCHSFFASYELRYCSCRQAAHPAQWSLVAFTTP